MYRVYDKTEVHIVQLNLLDFISTELKGECEKLLSVS